MKTKKYDIFLESGVSIDIPEHLDPKSDEGWDLIKRLARERFINLLREEDFDIDVTPFLDFNEAETPQS